jgi:putative endonuclease
MCNVYNMFHMSHNKTIGALGEGIVCKFLMKHGYSIVDRNFLRKWGEIDIVAKKGEELHFVEVKSVSRESIGHGSVGQTEAFRPEDNVHPWKLQRMSRVIQSYLAEKNVSDETNWKFDVVTVYLNVRSREARVEILEDIIIS